MEVGRLSLDWFRILVGDTIDYTEVRGWRKTGRAKKVNGTSFTELKAVRCIMDGPHLEDIYKIPEMSKPSSGDETVAFTSSLLKWETIDETVKGKSGDEKSDLYSHGRNTEFRPVSVPVKVASEPTFVFRTRSEVDILDDGYQWWRKYGQKEILGSTYPRSYYRCTFAGCNVKKQVQRDSSDPEFVETTYTGNHNHDIRGYNNTGGRQMDKSTKESQPEEPKKPDSEQ